METVFIITGDEGEERPAVVKQSAAELVPDLYALIKKQITPESVLQSDSQGSIHGM